MMQAAVVSVLLMAGVCGAPPSQCGCANSQVDVQQSDGNATGGISVYDGSKCGGRMCDGMGHDNNDRDGRLWSPVTPNGTVTYDRGPLGQPLFSPLWVIRGQQTFYPGNYAKPYDYREAFGYPWNGPRPLAPEAFGPPAVEPSPFTPSPFAARSPEPLAPPKDAWPAATAATYLRQSQARIASKPVLESP